VVQRRDGADGELQCEYHAEAATGREGWDYELAPGTIAFAAGAANAAIKVLIKGKKKYESKDTFLVHLTESPDCPGVLDTEEGACSCCVIVSDGGSPEGMANRFKRFVDGAVNVDTIAEGNLAWKEQFTMALQPVYGDSDDAAEADAKDWAIHLITLPWKLLFSFVPPPSYFGGWLCFCVALSFIGGVTALIGDLAALLGCVADIPDPITAITFVALGTSLPDMFASKAAAIQDATADAAVGNVTGSNAVNVFLGLGLPWMIASIYWKSLGRTPEWEKFYADQPSVIEPYPGGVFIVVAGDLVFSVLIFSLCAITALGILLGRRKLFGAELGGPAGAKMNTSIFLILLWFFYVGLASWKVIIGDVGTVYQIGAVMCGLFILFCSFVTISGLMALRKKMVAAHEKEISDITKAADKDLPTFKNLREAATHMRQHIEYLSQKCTDLEMQADEMEKFEKRPKRPSLQEINASKEPLLSNGLHLTINGSKEPLLSNGVHLTITAPDENGAGANLTEKKMKKRQSGKEVAAAAASAASVASSLPSSHASVSLAPSAAIFPTSSVVGMPPMAEAAAPAMEDVNNAQGEDADSIEEQARVE